MEVRIHLVGKKGLGTGPAFHATTESIPASGEVLQVGSDVCVIRLRRWNYDPAGGPTLSCDLFCEKVG